MRSTILALLLLSTTAVAQNCESSIDGKLGYAPCFLKGMPRMNAETAATTGGVAPAKKPPLFQMTIVHAADPCPYGQDKLTGYTGANALCVQAGYELTNLTVPQ